MTDSTTRDSEQSTSAPPRPQRKRRRLLFAALALLLVAAFVELASFCVLQFFATQPDVYSSESGLFDAHRNHRLNPTFELPGREGKRLHSPDGFRRDTKVSITKPPKTIRIMALGTSALYGIGASAPYPVHRPLNNDETITGVLEASLNDRLAQSDSEFRVEVINAGVSAYQTFHELMYLNADLLDYRPDIVINIDGHNDFYRTAPIDRWAEYSYSTSILVDEYNGRSFFLPWLTGVRAAAPYSNFFNLLEKANKRVWYLTKVEKLLPNTPCRTIEANQDFDSNVREIARTTFLRDLWQIHQLGKRQGYDHCVFLQPEVVLEDAASLTDDDRNIQQITLDHLPAGAAQDMHRIRELLPSLFADEGIPFHDVSNLAAHNASSEDLYIDYCHLSPAGARAVAAQIELILLPMIEVRIEAALAQQK
ncbi:MAG: SGNH/GDSL hydrolase family protein [Planctomycetota bacterium]|jgi:lysophospholipase L1-like esterase